MKPAAKYLLPMAIAVSAIGTACKSRQDSSASDVKFYGYDNQRFAMEYDGYFYMKPSNDSEIILEESYKSLKYLFGAFQWHNEFVAYKGIPHKFPAIKINKKETVEIDGNTMMKVSYTFDDEVVFNKSLQKTNIDFWMPTDRLKIYSLGLEDGKNKCTDDHYQSEGDFWYFWNPEKTGCPAKLKEGLIKVSATFKAIPNTLNKFPQYGWLGSASKKIVYIGHGVDKNFTEEDAGVKAWAGTIAELERLSFTAGEKLIDQEDSKHWIYSKTVNGSEVEIHLGRFKSGDTAFTEYGRQGLQTADIFIYNGHSGLGGHLPPKRFAPLTLPKKYQVFFFNGCSTFAYYNENYFDLKAKVTGGKGTEKLDIITTGLEAWFGVQPYVTASLIEDLLIAGQHPKWEEIIKKLYSQTGKYRYGDQLQWKMDEKKYSGHYQVNGDEDNPSDLTTALKRD